jgi:hypothetical protein
MPRFTRKIDFASLGILDLIRPATAITNNWQIFRM